MLTNCAVIAIPILMTSSQANLIAVAVLGADGSGSTAGVIAGVDYVANDHQTKRNRCVANMSLGGGYSLAMNRAVEEGIAAGCQFAVAAGNENNDACFSSPASAPDCVTVSSSDQSDKRSYFFLRLLLTSSSRLFSLLSFDSSSVSLCFSFSFYSSCTSLFYSFY